MLALIGLIIVPVLTVTSSANAAPTVDRTCQARGEHITTCEWLVQSIIYDKFISRNDTQFGTWAEMEGGTANREIIQVQLQFIACVAGCAVQIARESSLDVIGGSGSITAHLENTLCNDFAYRPRFEFKYFQPKPANDWVTGWSYGSWQYTYNTHPCYAGTFNGK